MHRFDISIPHFVTYVRSMHIVVTSDIVSKVLHVPRVAYPNYPGYNHLRTVSKDELSFLFYETPSSWGDHQKIPCSSFAKGPRFLNMVMTFVLHPLSHYNSITESHARFLLSFLKRLTIDFPSCFILSLIDVYRDTVTYDKLIFPFVIMWILHHFSVSYPTKTATLPVSSAPSTSTPSSSASGVTLKAVMAQLQCMNSRLDTLSDELCQENTRVGRIV